MGDIVSVVIGTAGHIDHGKSSLVRRLTGVDPDRLKEEKDRELTIDLGFAPYELPSGQTVGLIDVPGHERFVKNMVAGATGVDMVLLVVAADDGVMPQTREHLEILTLLGLEHGIVVVTKVDMPGVDDELVELLELELEELLEGTFLAAAPVYRVDSLSGRGFEELQAAIATAVEELKPPPAEGAFRMPIQRVFSARGFGTVVTGIPLHGTLKTGGQVEVVTGRETFKGRVRGLQAYGQKVDAIRAGHSSAINLTDVDYKKVARGDTVCTSKLFTADSLFEVRLTYLASQQKPLRQRETVRFHVGTSEVLGEVVLLEHKVLEPGGSGLCQIRLREPLVAVTGDRFVVRRHSPMETIGGGVVLGASKWRLKPFKGFVLDRLGAREGALDSPAEQLVLELDQAPAPLRIEDLVKVMHQPLASVREELEALVAAGGAVEVSGGKGSPVYVSRDGFARAQETACGALETFHGEHPWLDASSRLDLRARTKLADGLLNRALGQLVASERVLEKPPGYALASHAPQLTEAAESFLAELLKLYSERAFTTPTRQQALEALATDDLSEAQAQDLLQNLIYRGELVPVGDDLVFHRQRYAEAQELVRQEITSSGPMTAATFKERIASSRRYTIPLLEHFDEIGLTRREGDRRVLRK